MHTQSLSLVHLVCIYKYSSIAGLLRWNEEESSQQNLRHMATDTQLEDVLPPPVVLNPSLIIPILLIPLLSLSLLAVQWRRLLAPSSRSPAIAGKRHLPPSPPTLPVIGNLHQLGTYPHRTMQTLARRYGPIMLIHLGRAPAVVISSAHLAREVMKTHDIVFSDRPKSSSAYRLLYDGKDVSLSPYGEYWRQMRSICVLQLLSHKRVQSFRSVREEEVGLLVKKIEDSSPDLMDLSDVFATLTSDVICRVALGRKYGESNMAGRRFKAMLEEFMGLLGRFNVGDCIPSLGWINRLSGFNSRVERVAKEFDDFLEGVVEEHTSKLLRPSQEDSKSNNNNSKSIDDFRGGEGDQKKDFVDVLLEVQKDNLAGFPLSRLSIKALILVCLLQHGKAHKNISFFSICIILYRKV